MSENKKTEQELGTIKMTAKAETGSFVKTLEGKTGTGFADGWHVHKDWMAKTIDWDKALEMAHNAARTREDIPAGWDEIVAKVNDDDKFVLEIKGRDFSPTDYALVQLSLKAGVRSASILREMYNDIEADEHDADVMAHIVNNEIRKQSSDKKLLLRTYSDGTLRAVLTERYAPVDNRWYLETLREFLPDARLSHWKGNEDTIYGNLLIPDSIMDYGQGDSDYGGMLSIGNCEIGTRTVMQRPSLFRSICMNGCIWGQCFGKKIKQRHIGKIDLETLKKEIAENVAYQLPLYETGVHRFLEMQKRTIKTAKMEAVIAVACLENKIEKSKVQGVFEQWKQHESDHADLFGVINAITRAGQELKPAEWVRFDEVAGQLLDLSEDRWNLYVKKASQFTKKDYEKSGLVLAA